MEDITPLFIYISSCEKYYHENDHGEICFIEISLFTDFDERVFFDRSIIRNSICPDFNKEEHRIFDIKMKKYEYFNIQGYCERFLRPSMLSINGNFKHLQTEEERLEFERQRREIAEERLEAERQRREIAEANDSDSDDNDDEEKEELSINDFKTFKLEQCVICLEEEPKVLFCNCGHLCICEKCLVHRYDNCPVCKKETTILRMIE